MIAAGRRSSLPYTGDASRCLKEAGVVDSGGQGLVQVLKGAYDAYLGKEIDYTVDAAEERDNRSGAVSAPADRGGDPVSATVPSLSSC